MTTKEHMTRLRQRAQDGYMTVQALSIVVLLLGTMLAIVKMAESRVSVAEKSQSVTDVRRSIDRSEAYLYDTFNQTSDKAPFGVNGTEARGAAGVGVTADGIPLGEVSGGLGDKSKTWWKSDPVNKSVTVTAVNDGSVQVRERAVRGVQFTESGVEDDDVIVYDVPAGPRQMGGVGADAPGAVYGLWGNAVSTWKNDGDGTGSWINGAVHGPDGEAGEGTWGVYGGSINFWSDALKSQARFVTYNDDAHAQLNASRKSRSAMTARFDRSVINKLMDQVRNNTLDCADTRDISLFGSLNEMPYQCHRTAGSAPVVISSQLNAALNNGVGQPPVRTVVVKGDLTIKNNINVPNSQVHFYVDGDVKFETLTNAHGSSLALNNVFIYAPNGTCSTHSAGGSQVSVQINGSLACQRVVLGDGVANPTIRNNSVRWVEPWPTQTVTTPYVGLTQTVTKPKHLFFFERSGFVDQWTQ